MKLAAGTRKTGRHMVLVCSIGAGRYPTGFLEELRRLFPSDCEVVIPSSWSEDEISTLAFDADVIIGNKVSSKVIDFARRLRLIQAPGTGVDQIDLTAAARRGVLVCNAAGMNAVWVAEHAIALLLALAKNIVQSHEKVKAGVWHRIVPKTLQGKTLGIVGLGSIGTEVARRMKSFGMRIVAVKRHPSKALLTELGIDFLGGPGDLEFILRESDYVVLTVPSNSETRKMIGKKELNMMKKTSHLINVSRGAVVDESALLRALTEGKIAGAGLDVFEKEPVDSKNPLLKLQNVTLTPHSAGGLWSPESTRERAQFIVKNVLKALRGEKPANVVDTRLRYAVNRST